ncbi:MAG: hypothetical protein Q9201_005279 [Fulgogasparrea decipioides]
MSASLAQLSSSELAQIPAVSPPPGVGVNFDGPSPLAYTITVVSSIFIGLTFLFLGVRVYAKVKIHRQWSWDDGNIKRSFRSAHKIHTDEDTVTCAIGVVCFLGEVENEGFGRHLWNVPLGVFISEDFLKLAYISSWLSNVAYIFVKLTLFILYWNIFRLFRWLKFGILGGAFVVTGVHTAFILYIVISDSPGPGQTWLEKFSASHNGGGVKLAIPLSAWALVSDFYLLLLPISGVLRLQLSPRRKLALLMVFMTGIGACVCSSLSIYYRTLLVDEDVTYTAIRIQALAVIELCVGIMISCVPTTSVFLRHILPPTGALWSKSRSVYKELLSRLQIAQRQASHKTDSNKGKVNKADGPYQHLKDRGFAVNEAEAYNLGSYGEQRTNTRSTAQPSGDYWHEGIS